MSNTENDRAKERGQVSQWEAVVMPIVLGTLLIGTSLLITMIIYVGEPVETDPVLSILWPWAMGAATIHWGLPYFKKAVAGDSRD